MQVMPAPGRTRSPPWWRVRIDRAFAWRDRLVASPAFQRRAASFALSAPIARSRSRRLFDLVAGFVYSQVLLACVQVRVFDLIAESGPTTPHGLAPRLGLSLEATERLVAAAVSLKLLEWRGDGRVGLGALGAPMVGNQAIAAMVLHHGALYADLRDPVALLRGEQPGTALGDYWSYASARGPADENGSSTSGRGTADAPLPESVAAYSALMTASQPLVAEDILDAYDFGAHRLLLDVGGGEGAFVARVAARHAALHAISFDLPPVAERARARFAEAGLAGRAQAIGGSFLSDALPAGADVATLVRVVHDHDDEAALRLLQAVRAALGPGGTLVLAEPLAQTRGAEPMGDAYFGFYLLAMGQGRPRTAAELGRLLRLAGFDTVREQTTRRPLQTRMLVAHIGNTALAQARQTDV